MLFSVAPFTLPFSQIFVAIDSKLELFSIEVDFILDYPIYFLGYIETIISQPFAPLLRSLGWWSSNGIFVGPNGPLLPGSFLVAIIYSILLYIGISFISATWEKRHDK